MLRDVDEIPDNVCGVIGNRYVIAGPVDEPIEKAFMHFHLYDSDPKGEKKQPLYAMIGRHAESRGPIHMSIKVLEKVKGRSVHFPEIIQRGKIEKVHFSHLNSHFAEEIIKRDF
ncbi:unnamed protein product [Onchocerca flexuosa]|uniref:DUF296 domain-containing protein n=1 Tax=Onchocerca flexuosa TaxID=387005 RepID=A0A183HR22_9BILA|nr:unnamed protein product [Onchocerca flexuosa]